jgi:hypothetical protein
VTQPHSCDAGTPPTPGPGTSSLRPSRPLETDTAGTPKPVARHPEKAVTIERVDFYDQEQFEAFYASLKRSRG